jgi:hypothetical protein
MASFASSGTTIDTVINVRDNLIFTISSMNPPQPGHVGVLIYEMMKLASRTGEQNVYVFFGSDKYDSIDYPLSCEDRTIVLNFMIDYLKRNDTTVAGVNVIFMYEEGKHNGLLYFRDKINQYFSIAPGKTKQINGFFVAGGDDRLTMINNVRSIVGPDLRQHFKNGIEQVHLLRDESRNQKFGEGSFDPRDLSQISSTIVNKFVDSGNEGGFTAIYDGWLPPEQIEWLWNRLKAVRGKGPGTVSGADATFPSMFTKTGTIMGHNPNIGGKRRRTIRRKRKTIRKRRTNKKRKTNKRR